MSCESRKRTQVHTLLVCATVSVTRDVLVAGLAGALVTVYSWRQLSEPLGCSPRQAENAQGKERYHKNYA